MRWLIVLLLLLPVSGMAAPRVFDSGNTRVTLLELYTSEGCSSCPPADEWLSTLRYHPGLWARLVPVAFHVDYWDRLGWRDRFADARFSRRQQRYATLWGHGVVYTPGFVVDGREWRGGPQRGAIPMEHDSPAGRLTARLNQDRLEITYRSRDGAADTIAHVALLGFDRETPVKAGENRGLRLHHDFVVLDYRRAPLNHRSEGRLAATVRGPRPAKAPTALAIWVTSGEAPTPLQATGGWLQPPR